MGVDVKELDKQLAEEEAQLWDRLNKVIELRKSFATIYGTKAPEAVITGPEPPNIRKIRTHKSHGRSTMPISELVLYVLKRAGKPMVSAAIAGEIWEDTRIDNKPATVEEMKTRTSQGCSTLHSKGILRATPLGWELVSEAEQPKQ